MRPILFTGAMWLAMVLVVLVAIVVVAARIVAELGWWVFCLPGRFWDWCGGKVTKC